MILKLATHTRSAQNSACPLETSLATSHHPRRALWALALAACGAGGSPPGDDDKQLADPASLAVALNNAQQRYIAADMSISTNSH